ncbi:diguanylate cyclase/phosphodiesterase /diguanylate cyclase/phosphodiesterase with GAF sensor [Marinobacter pelagius]|uniref:Diguanylate cyclase/phosphodiesterase /diguanylate cyclase/phosphodiesterase with GAF sensor n=1 Tax=Marinobacter pelagius TaxID=379482 RepID=A0A366GRD8_9GAMM|nr:sensor domain-containing phosphodiesterase [Marinobacter pelagius]RBP30003.1 diguanylate cyclase/phosphodiesterase /diguanylate cyclase/phosphodiesterase with GAF sensor [Marinobacter pelagius]
MAAHPLPKQEFDYLSDPARLEALYRLNIIDTGTEGVFDTITRLTASLFEVELATIHLIDDHRQWVKASSNGICAPDTPVGKTFCERTVAKKELVLVPDLQKDPVYNTSHFVTGPLKLRFYAGMPLISRDGHAVGTLCLLDTRANIFEWFSDHDLSLYRYLADLVIRTMELRESHVNAQKRFLQASEEDGVTGLVNSRGVLAHLNEQFSKDNSLKSVAGMIQVRLPGLERIRRAYGTPFSNELLQQVVERIQKATQPADLLARTDDVSLLLTRISSASTGKQAINLITQWAAEQGQKLLEEFESPFVCGGENFYLSAQLGLAHSLSSDPSGYSVLERADDAAVKAQKDTPNASSMCWGNSELKEEYKHAVATESRLRQAVEQEQLAVVFQPIVDLNAGNKIIGAEALVRWPDSGEPPIGPDVFVPLAEELGLIGKMGSWVFDTACRTLRHWRDVSRQDLWMSVNVSPKQLQDPALASQLETITLNAGLRPSQIKLEITESGLIEQYGQVTQLLKKLVDCGFKLALDDFGTGHSSLSRLIQLPFDVLKVDRAFVSDSPEGAGAAVVASLSSLAKSLNLETVGEGVETDTQEAFLRQHGYCLAQGYRYARPLTANGFLDELDKQNNN